MAEIGIIWADDADLQAIYDYVERQRPNIAKYPKLQPLIEDFERWYSRLNYFDVHVMINDTLGEAARRRDQINAAQGAFFDPTIVPGDKVGLTPGSGVTAGPKPPIIPTKYKLAATIAGGALATLVILKKLYII